MLLDSVLSCLLWLTQTFPPSSPRPHVLYVCEWHLPLFTFSLKPSESFIFQQDLPSLPVTDTEHLRLSSQKNVADNKLDIHCKVRWMSGNTAIIVNDWNGARRQKFSHLLSSQKLTLIQNSNFYVKWCAFAAIQRTVPSFHFTVLEEKRDKLQGFLSLV